MYSINESCKNVILKKYLFFSSFVSSISGLKVILVEENAFCNGGFPIIKIQKYMIQVQTTLTTNIYDCFLGETSEMKSCFKDIVF